ncbi:hypothetical protein [Paenisporosarcina sp. OV554]|uniref:hypothetical protein n=1 Tax=Paenisporosarcina sp. OV554 TaxID=2135694 RepID=UPI000D3CB7FF|nr:hypothetical protein [Paenisporosarcina sp. OV554]PUB12221.1 hypothetical protein C8K15_11026 [Paenisporosarcina sp. OV554]
MNLWIGDYLKLRNEIHYLQFNLTDKLLVAEDIKETQLMLDEYLQREGQFKIIINSFVGLESQILKKKYVDIVLIILGINTQKF